MAMVITLAVLKLKLTADEAIRAATLGGACSLRLQHEIGSLEVGKRCDAAVLNVRKYQEIPYHFGVNHCLRVVVGGRPITHIQQTFALKVPRGRLHDAN